MMQAVPICFHLDPMTTVNGIMQLVDEGFSVHVAVLDFSKAFDRVCRQLLIQRSLIGFVISY